MLRTIGCLATAGLLTVAACGNDEEQTPPPPAPAAPAQPQAQPQQPAAPAQPAQPAQPQGGNLASNFGTVSLSPGFIPDPNVVTGTSGGGMDAATLDPSCAGWISQTPDHILAAGGNFANLRVMARSDGDITLVVQKPDGSYLCNDDSDGTNPLVASAMAPGNYKIWIGSYNQGTNSQYQLGFSELASVTPSSLGQ